MDYKHRQEFFNLIEGLFIGSTFQDLKNSKMGGFTNLLSLKAQYYKQIKQSIESRFKSLGDDKQSENNKEELYGKLIAFLESFVSPETGSMFFNNTPFFKNTYYKVNKSEDVHLFYKTRDLYYVKSDPTYSHLAIETSSFILIFDTKELNNKQGNEKKDLRFYFYQVEESDGKTQITIELRWASDGEEEFLKDSLIAHTQKEGFENLLKTHIKGNSLDKKNLEAHVLELKKAFNDYLKQTTVDYFIHKNPEHFLKEQYKMFFYQYIFEEGSLNEWSSERLKTLQQYYDFGQKAITDIAQLEKQLGAMWLKPKFPFSLNYLISLEKIAQKNPALLDNLLSKYKDILVEEWETLGLMASLDVEKDTLDPEEKSSDALFNKKADATPPPPLKTPLAPEYKNLTLDTKHLSLKDKTLLLSQFTNLSAEITGTAIKGDNYQALNTLQSELKEKVKCIYIDPPYNSPSSEIVYVNGFKDSTWLTMMKNRLEIAKGCLAEDGVLICAIDDNEVNNLGLLLKEVFPDSEQYCITVVHNPRGVIGKNFSAVHEYAYFVLPQGEKLIDYVSIENPDFFNLRNWGGESLRTDAKNCYYPILIKDDKIIGFGDVVEDVDVHPINYQVIDGLTHIYPIDKNGIERKWRYARQSVEEVRHLLRVKSSPNSIDIELGKDFGVAKTIWTDKKYDSNENGSKIVKNLLPKAQFSFPKSLYIIKDCIQLVKSLKKDGTVMDFFGGSGTTAHAVLKMNQEDGGNRKFIIMEQNDYFDTVILPRIKKTAYSQNFKEGKALDSTTGQGVFVEYFGMEQYENTLEKAHYHNDHFNLEKDKKEETLATPDLSEKLLFNGLNIQQLENGDKEVLITLKDIYENKIDILEIAKTLSLAYGKTLYQIKDENTFALQDKDGDVKDFDIRKMYLKDYPELKPFLYWND